MQRHPLITGDSTYLAMGLRPFFTNQRESSNTIQIRFQPTGQAHRSAAKRTVRSDSNRCAIQAACMAPILAMTALAIGAERIWLSMPTLNVPQQSRRKTFHKPTKRRERTFSVKQHPAVFLANPTSLASKENNSQKGQAANRLPWLLHGS